MSESKSIFWDEVDENESCQFCDIVFFCDTKPVYNTEDEGETVEEEVGAKNKIYFPMSVITKTSDDNVHDKFSVFYILYIHDLLLWVLKKS